MEANLPGIVQSAADAGFGSQFTPGDAEHVKLAQLAFVFETGISGTVRRLIRVGSRLAVIRMEMERISFVQPRHKRRRHE